MDSAVLIAASALLGLIVGSFVTMVVDRVPDKLALLRPGPRCGLCEASIARKHLVPVVSWFQLKGRCASCDERFGIAYPIVEIVTAIAFAGAAWRIGTHWDLIGFFVFFAALIALSTVDFFEYWIPDRILFPVLGASLVLIAVISVLDGETVRILWALAGALLYGVVLGLPALIKPDKLGLGDAKLALLIGLYLGWLGEYIAAARLILMSLLMSCAIGVVLGLAIFFARKITGKDLLPDPEREEGAAEGLMAMPFPFGPALAIGSFLGVMMAPSLLSV